MRGIQKETSRRPRTEISTCMSEVLALAVEALVPLRHGAVNVCLVKFPGLVVNQFRTYCLTSSSEVNRLPLRAFLGDLKWRNRKRRGLGCMESDHIGRLTHASASF